MRDTVSLDQGALFLVGGLPCVIPLPLARVPRVIPFSLAGGVPRVIPFSVAVVRHVIPCCFAGVSCVIQWSSAGVPFSSGPLATSVIPFSLAGGHVWFRFPCRGDCSV